MASRKTARKKAEKKSLPRFQTRYALVFVALMLIIGAAIVYFTRASSATYTWNPTTGAQSGRLFSSDSPLNQPIPADVQYRADGQTRIQAAGPPANLSQLTWAVPVFDVDASTPKAKVFCYVYACDAITNTLVPIPNGVFGQQGSDGHVTIIDHSTRKIYDYWIWKNCDFVVNFVSANWCPASAGTASIDGNGVGGGTNVAALAGGMIRTYEVEAGVIDHALTFATGTTCQGTPYYPALYSDGTTTNQTNCMPIGSRIQLDPSVNVDALPGITPFEKMVAKALQKYGAYANDTSLTFGFGMEFDRTGRNVYTRAGLPAGDYSSMSRIPWDKVKMIQPQWNSDGTKAYAWGNTNTPAPSVAPVPIAPPPTGPGTNGTSAAANAVPKTSSGATNKPSSPQTKQQATAPTSSPQVSPTSPAQAPDEDPATLIENRKSSLMPAISSKVISSVLFVNRSLISWKAIDGATKYQVRINTGSPKTTTKLETTIWHFGNGSQNVFVQGVKDDGSYVGDEMTLTVKPSCTWYGVCK